MFVQIWVIFLGVKSYGQYNPSFSLGKGMKIGCLSSVLAKMISFPAMIILMKYVFPNTANVGNMMGILGFPIALFIAGVLGAVIGFFSGFFVR